MTSATDNRPRNCRHCSHMTCGDANWCEKKEITLSDSKIRVHTKCGFWEWNSIDALMLEDPEHDRAMTDNRATEKKPPAEAKGDCTICKGWVDDGRGGTCVFADDYWSPHCPYDEQDRPIRDVSPEQAIAATLGGVGSEVGSEVCGEKLTAEQVREAIERHSIESLGCRRQFRERDWQAIADELNAAMGALEPHSNQHEPSRWHELFGTPERAAQMLEESCHLLYGLRIDGWVSCAGCPVFAKDADVDDCCYSKLLEWLRGDSE